MNSRTIVPVLAGVSLLLALHVSAAAAATWPVTQNVQGYTVTGYQPQATDWPNRTKLIGMMAVSVVAPGTTNPVYGVVYLSADTTADVPNNTVLVANLQVTSTKFATVSTAEAQKLDSLIKSNLSELGNRVVPMNTILLSLKSSSTQSSRTVNLNTAPPKIYYSSTPAILVSFDGTPTFAQVKGVSGSLKFAINTNWNLFQVSSTYYLLNNTSWLMATSVNGPWKAAGKLPAVLSQLPNDSNWSEVRKQLSAAPPTSVPTVWVATTQAEAIVTSGAPKLVAIPNTALSYVDNTDAALFYLSTNKNYYYLSSGRWFSTTSLSSGSWTFASKNLPADFAKIPASGPRGWVLASVPGTPQAQAAVGAASVPRVAQLSRSGATLSVTYTGDPQFKPIANTNLSYAVNTSYDVVRVGSGDPYYACNNGAWFTSSAATGPWALAGTVPDSIYAIPASSPLYNCTYVTVVGSTSDYVTYSYTGGYLYNYPWYGGLYYGTGWYAPPYFGYYGGYPYYYGWPRTYVGGTYYNTATGAYARGYGVYGPYGGAHVGAGYNPSTGNYYRGGSVYGPYGGAGHGTVYNPVTGNYYHGAAAWGPNGIVYRGSGGNVNNLSYSNRYGYSASSMTAANPYKNWGNAAQIKTVPQAQYRAGAGANVYAGADGNVYRPSSSGANWQQYDNRSGGWRNTGMTTTGGYGNRSSYQGSFNTANQLNRDSFARSAGYGGGGFGGGRIR